MVWQPEIDELKHRKHLAEQMGGKEGVARHHAQGKLTVRERIAEIADPDSFREIGVLAGAGTYGADQQLTGFTPLAEVVGVCSLNGRKVVISGGDSTLGGGGAPGGAMYHGGSKGGYAQQVAAEWRLPYIGLLDPAGGGGASLLGSVPVVSAVMGSVAGLPTGAAYSSHFSVMVKAALGEGTDKEIEDRRAQVFESGAVDNLAETEQEALAVIKRFLDYLPSSVWQVPPRVEATDDPNRRDEELLSIVPRDRKKQYDPYQILRHVMDRDSFLEISPLYGQSRITGLTRVNGYPVAVMINNPDILSGAMDMAARLKVIRFLNLCDTFHLPLVYLADEPGFEGGPEAQKQGAARAGARIAHVTGRTRMPWITFIIGVAGQQNIRPSGMYRRYGWPSANWGGASPLQMAENFGVIEDIIDPRDTRPILSSFVELAQDVIKTQLGPTRAPVYQP